MSMKVSCSQTLEFFIGRYGRELLVPAELPQIARVARLAAASCFREIILEDVPPDAVAWDRNFQSASRRVGRAQLRRLRPLRDVKGLARYRQAVDSGKATGTHTVVFGIMLGLYSIPLRQGLSHYASQTIHSLADSGADRLGLPLEERQSVHGTLDSVIWSLVQQKVDELLPSTFAGIEPGPGSEST